MGLFYNFRFIKNVVIKDSSSGKDLKLISLMGYVVYVVTFFVLIFSLICGKYNIAVYMYFLIWLWQMAYVDHVTGYVYDRMTVTGIIPLALSIALINDGDILVILNRIISSLPIIIIIIILGKASLIGRGDVDVLIIVSEINSMYLISDGICDIYRIFLLNICFIYLSVILFVITHWRRIIWRKMKLDRSYPMIPSIYAAAVIGVILFFTFNF